jgi:hypothetical protein
MSQSPEIINIGPENKIESYNMAAEQLEKIGKDKSSEKLSDNNETKAESARDKAVEVAISIENKSKVIETTNNSTPFKKIESINKNHLDKSYKKTMKQVQKELSPAARTFSKVIHNKVIEKISDTASNTIARPNSILFGSFSAFVITLAVYLMAKSSGYQLSGSESILSFTIGWIIGVIFDYLRVMITGKK